jgi:hypothetical protein
MFFGQNFRNTYVRVSEKRIIFFLLQSQSQTKTKDRRQSGWLSLLTLAERCLAAQNLAAQNLVARSLALWKLPTQSLAASKLAARRLAAWRLAALTLSRRVSFANSLYFILFIFSNFFLF